MNDTDELLPAMMRRATEQLRPDAAELVRRGMRRGRQLRRRRTVGICLAAASAVVVTAAGALAAGALVPQRQQVQVATPSTPAPLAPSPTGRQPPPAPAPGDAQKAALEVLRSVVPSTFVVSQPKTWGGDGHAGASVVVDDAMGLSELSVLLRHRGDSRLPTCPPTPSRGCLAVEDRASRPGYAKERNPSGVRGVVYNSVVVHHPDGLEITLTSYNAPAGTGAPATRKSPPFMVERLLELANSPRWQVARPSAGSTAPTPSTPTPN